MSSSFSSSKSSSSFRLLFVALVVVSISFPFELFFVVVVVVVVVVPVLSLCNFSSTFLLLFGALTFTVRLQSLGFAKLTENRSGIPLAFTLCKYCFRSLLKFFAIIPTGSGMRSSGGRGEITSTLAHLRGPFTTGHRSHRISTDWTLILRGAVSRMMVISESLLFKVASRICPLKQTKCFISKCLGLGFLQKRKSATCGVRANGRESSLSFRDGRDDSRPRA